MLLTHWINQAKPMNLEDFYPDPADASALHPQILQIISLASVRISLTFEEVSPLMRRSGMECHDRNYHKGTPHSFQKL
jgi:hypothetical protein